MSEGLTQTSSHVRLHPNVPEQHASLQCPADISHLSQEKSEEEEIENTYQELACTVDQLQQDIAALAIISPNRRRKRKIKKKPQLHMNEKNKNLVKKSEFRHPSQPLGLYDLQLRIDNLPRQTPIMTKEESQEKYEENDAQSEMISRRSSNIQKNEILKPPDIPSERQDWYRRMTGR